MCVLYLQTLTYQLLFVHTDITCQPFVFLTFFSLKFTANGADAYYLFGYDCQLQSTQFIQHKLWFL